MSNIELHQGAHRAMSDEGAEQAAAFFASDVVFTDCARDLTMKGRDEATGWLADWKSAFSDASVVDATYLEAGDWTIARFRGQGMNDGPVGELPATGRQLDLPCCELLHWHEGKAVEGAFYYDTGTMMTQLGYLPAPATS